MPLARNNESEALVYKMISPQRTGRGSTALTLNKLNGTNDLPRCITDSRVLPRGDSYKHSKHAEKVSG